MARPEERDRRSQLGGREAFRQTFNRSPARQDGGPWLESGTLPVVPGPGTVDRESGSRR